MKSKKDARQVGRIYSIYSKESSDGQLERLDTGIA
jgi:hypothetical protein